MRISPTPGSVSGRRVDRLGDPLDGLINLFDLALVLAVGLLLAALSSAGVVGLVSGGTGGSPIPGEPGGSGQASGQGTEVGKVYRLQDGSYVFAPAGPPRTGSTGATGGAATPQQAVPPAGSTGGTTTPPGSTGGTTTPNINPGTPPTNGL